MIQKYRNRNLKNILKAVFFMGLERNTISTSNNLRVEVMYRCIKGRKNVIILDHLEFVTQKNVTPCNDSSNYQVTYIHDSACFI